MQIYPDKLRLTTIQCFFSCIQSAIWAVAVERNISAWKLGWDLNLLVVAYWCNFRSVDILVENLGDREERPGFFSCI
ncbi:unnamed protein product [Camellia sinensis]